MLIIVLLISISLTIAIGFLLVFIWNLKSGQYEDTYTPSVRMLFDNQTSKPPTKDVSLDNNEQHSNRHQ
jgi:cbb3-type cytochrome oxidase maturation protein